MEEGITGFRPPEAKLLGSEQNIEEEPANPVELWIAKRWQEINESNNLFEENEQKDSLNLTEFMDKEVNEWEDRHKLSEYVDTTSPFELVRFLLAILCERGSEWTQAKKDAVRRTLYKFTRQSVGAMTLEQQGILNRTILAKPLKAGKLSRKENVLIKQWLNETVGRGIR